MALQVCAKTEIVYRALSLAMALPSVLHICQPYALRSVNSAM